MALESLLPTYTHRQTSASARWEFRHGLKTEHPQVDCWVGDGETDTRILPSAVDVTNDGVVTLLFSREMSGHAIVR